VLAYSQAHFTRLSSVAKVQRELHPCGRLPLRACRSRSRPLQSIKVSPPCQEAEEISLPPLLPRRSPSLAAPRSILPAALAVNSLSRGSFAGFRRGIAPDGRRVFYHASAPLSGRLLSPLSLEERPVLKASWQREDALVFLAGSHSHQGRARSRFARAALAGTLIRRTPALPGRFLPLFGASQVLSSEPSPGSLPTIDAPSPHPVPPLFAAPDASRGASAPAPPYA
jgi:hypothetical protein